MNNKQEVISIHASFKQAITDKYDLLIKALEQDKRISIKWNEKEKTLKLYIEDLKRI